MNFDLPPMPNWAGWAGLAIAVITLPAGVAPAWRWIADRIASWSRKWARGRADKLSRDLLLMEYLHNRPSSMTAMAASRVILAIYIAVIGVCTVILTGIAGVLIAQKRDAQLPDVFIDSIMFTGWLIVAIACNVILFIGIRMRSLSRMPRYRHAILRRAEALLTKAGVEPEKRGMMIEQLVKNAKAAKTRPDPFGSLASTVSPERADYING